MILIKKVKRIIRDIVDEIDFIYSYPYVGKIYKLNYNIMTINETFDFISKQGNSMIRFGDGEINIINGISLINYQSASRKLALELRNAAMINDKSMLVCFPDTLECLDDKKKRSKNHWVSNFRKNYVTYKELHREGYIYGNAFISRPYMIYKEKNSADLFFTRFREFLKGKDILIIEGKYSRNGVGNNLFLNANSIKRVLCPNKNAFEKIDIIFSETLKFAENRLVLVSLGPAAKPLCVKLHKKGIWVWDIGHIDSEYEWFLKGSEQRFVLHNKHTAEHQDRIIEDCNDENYLKSIVSTIE